MQDYTTIAGVLRLHEQHLSQRDIAAKYSIGKGTVARILEKAKKFGIDYSIIKDADPDEVMERFYSMRMSSSSKPLPDFEKIYKKLHEKNSPGTNTKRNIQMACSTHSSAPIIISGKKKTG